MSSISRRMTPRHVALSCLVRMLQDDNVVTREHLLCCNLRVKRAFQRNQNNPPPPPLTSHIASAAAAAQKPFISMAIVSLMISRKGFGLDF